MAKPGEYDFVPFAFWMGSYKTLSVSIFQWVYRADGHGLKKSKAVYRVKGPAHKWKEINERARFLCNVWNSAGVYTERMVCRRRKSETI